MKTVRVVAAIIRDGDRIFAAKRGYGEFQGGWEFPGGKIEVGETPEEALVREIKEELDTTIAVGEHILCVEYDYPTFHLSMECYWASIVDGQLTTLEHADAAWLPLDDLYQVDWLPADVDVVNAIAIR